MSRSTDKRVLRTKRLLRDAMTELIEEKGFERITVCDLTERAEINRGTFYAHYKDKNDLLAQNENEIINDINDIIKSLHRVTVEDVIRCYRANTPLPFAVALYDYLRENGNFVKALIGPKGDPAFQTRMKQIVSENLVTEVLNPKYRIEVAPLTKYYVAFYTSAQIGVIQAWLEGGMKESSEEMARYVVAIMFMKIGDPITIGEHDGSSILSRFYSLATDEMVVM